MKAKSLAASFAYAVAGIKYCFLTQRNMRIHTLIAVFTVFLAWQLRFSNIEFLILVITIISVLVAEMINTAIETIVDMVSPQYHPLAKIAKNVAAGAVLTTATASVIVGYILFFHRLFG